MRGYLRTYLEVINTSFARFFEFKSHFLFILLYDLTFIFVYPLTGHILYHKIESVAFWDKNAFMLFISYALCLRYIECVLCSNNYWRFVFILFSGEFDYILLKPKSSIFITFFCDLRVTFFFTWWLPCLALYYYGTNFGLTTAQWILLLAIIPLGVVILILINLTITSMSFWVLRGDGLQYLRQRTQDLARWPGSIFPEVIRWTLTFIVPIVVYSTKTVSLLIDSFYILELLYLVLFAIVLFFVFRLVWNRGLKNYESASS